MQSAAATAGMRHYCHSLQSPCGLSGAQNNTFTGLQSGAVQEERTGLLRQCGRLSVAACGICRVRLWHERLRLTVGWIVMLGGMNMSVVHACTV